MGNLDLSLNLLTPDASQNTQRESTQARAEHPAECLILTYLTLHFFFFLLMSRLQLIICC